MELATIKHTIRDISVLVCTQLHQGPKTRVISRQRTPCLQAMEHQNHATSSAPSIMPTLLFSLITETSKRIPSLARVTNDTSAVTLMALLLLFTTALQVGVSTALNPRISSL